MFKGIVKNTFWLGSSEVVNKLLGLILTIYLVRYLGSADFGKLSFALAFVLLFGVLADFGFSTITTRDIAKDKKLTRKYLSNISSIKLIFGVVTFGLIVLVIQFLNKPIETEHIVYLAGIWVIVTSFVQFFVAVFRANEKMQYEAVSTLVTKLSLLIIVIVLLVKNFGLTNILIGYVVSALIGVGVTIYILNKKFARFSLEKDFRFWGHIIKESTPLVLGFSFMNVYYYIDTVILSFFVSNNEIGYYNAAYKIIITLIVGRRLFTTAIYPRAVIYYNKSKEMLNKVVSAGEKLAISLAVPLGIGGIILARKILILFYGSEYSLGSLAFQILFIQMFFVYVNLLFTPLLHATGRQKTYMKITAFSVFVNIILNFILIPKYGISGAAVATVFSEFSLFFLAYRIINKEVKIKLFSLFIKPLIAGVVMGVFLLFFNNLNVILLVILGSIIYLGIIYLIKGVSKEDLKIINKED